MKSILFVASVLVAFSVIYAADQATLLKQGKQLVANTEKALDEYHKQGKEHLLLAVEWQLDLVQTLIGMLEGDKHGFGDPMTPGQLELIDAQLQHAENRVTEELNIVKDYVAHAKHDNGTVQELVSHAQSMLSRTQTALKNDHSAQHESVHNDIDYEVRSIQNVVAQLSKAPHGTDLRKQIEALERNEISLNALLARIGANAAFY